MIPVQRFRVYRMHTGRWSFVAVGRRTNFPDWETWREAYSAAYNVAKVVNGR